MVERLLLGTTRRAADETDAQLKQRVKDWVRDANRVADAQDGAGNPYVGRLLRDGAALLAEKSPAYELDDEWRRLAARGERLLSGEETKALLKGGCEMTQLEHVNQTGEAHENRI